MFEWWRTMQSTPITVQNTENISNLKNINDAIIKRIEEVCKEKNINICEASLNGGKSPSAIYDLIKGRTKYSKVSTIKAFCQGADITLSEFFDKEYFNDFEE